jgi:alanine dehydrogenase
MTYTVGLPLMHMEAGERRAFLPCLVDFLDREGAPLIVIEEGYGTAMGLDPQAYLDASTKVKLGSYEDCLAQDVVVVVRCPGEDALKMISRDALLVSMLHYPTRPGRIALLAELGIRAVSMDSITDDFGRRLVENMEAVGWNGVQAAFHVLSRLYPRFSEPGRRPIRVTVLGSGAVGGHAVAAATRYGDRRLREQMVARRIPGVEVTVLDFDLTWNENYMLDRLEQTDLLVDATQRPDPSRPIVENEWLGALPQHAAILDLSVDPYDFSSNPPKVKGIEGIPEGNLDHYVFYPDDPGFGRIDPRVPAANRRATLSCYSWPGVHPKPCMEIYSRQLEPVLRVILAKPIETWSETRGTHYERAVARAELSRWRAAHAR